MCFSLSDVPLQYRRFVSISFQYIRIDLFHCLVGFLREVDVLILIQSAAIAPLHNVQKHHPIAHRIQIVQELSPDSVYQTGQMDSSLWLISYVNNVIESLI